MPKHFIFSISVLFSMGSLYGGSFATGLILARTTSSTQALEDTQEKVSQNPLVTQAEQNEKDFLNTYQECLQTNDCDTHQQYQQTRQAVLHSITQLMVYVDNLETDPIIAKYKSEKSEAKNIKKRLTVLLQKK